MAKSDVVQGDDLAEALREFSVVADEARKEYDNDCDRYWNSLSQEEQLRAFHSVCKRIYKGDVEDRRSYRGVIYDVFGFGPGAYAIGMDCGYFSIHNLIFDGLDKNEKN